MKVLDDMKLKTKLIGGFLAVVAILAAMAVMASNSMNTLNTGTRTLYEQDLVPIQLLGDAQAQLLGIRGDAYKLCVSKGGRDKIIEGIRGRAAALDKDLEAYKGVDLDADQAAGLADIDKTWESYKREVETNIALVNAGEVQQVFARLEDGGASAVARVAVNAAVGSLADRDMALAEQESKSAAAVYRRASGLNLAAAALAAVLALVLGFLLSTNIAGPLAQSADMLAELSKGRLDRRLRLLRGDEIGVMGRSLDALAEDLSQQALATEAIATGDLSVKVRVRSEDDAVAKSLTRVVEVLHGLQQELQRLVQASKDGQLDERGKAVQFKGSYAEIVGGVNEMLDAILLPIGEGNRILAQVSEGKIDEKIAQTYKGDHEKMKLAVNNVAVTVQGLQAELMRLTEASKNGQLGERGKPAQFKGAYAEIVGGVNQMLDAILLPIGEGNRILDQISVGKIDELIVQTYKGDHEKMKVAVNSVAITLQGLQKEMLRLTEASKDGLLGERGKAAQFKGAYAELVLGINQMLDAILLPIGEGNRILAHIASGKVDELIAQTYKGDHEKMKLAVNGVALALQALVADSVKLSKAAVDGRLDTRADASKHQGEYRSIVQGVNETLDAVLGPINEAAVVLDRMAAKDLTARVKGDYKGDHAKIKDAINTAAENLDKSMQQVAVGAEQVASATAQIGAGSQSLAQGSSEQASSIEEVSSSLQEMGSMTRQSVGNAKEAKTVAEQAKTAADKGVASMNLMSDAINKIKDSSDATAKIVKTIDEIAFQTNLLALNAAVEAARAGEAGKGFAVVAEEVRNLAMRSAEAAKNTANLIEGAVKNAENGVVLNQQVLLNFKEINDRANKVAEVVAEIAAASEQQDVGITQVNKAVEQMSQVTQQNAANAEESSSAAEELSSQSEEMRSMVANFTITGGAELSAAGKRAGHAAGHTVHSAPSNVVHLTGRDPKAALPLDEKDHRILKGF